MTMYRTMIQQTEDKYAPPSMPVLEVDVIGADAYLTFSDYTEDADGHACKNRDGVMVPLRDLLRALNVHWTHLAAVVPASEFPLPEDTK